MAKRIHPSSWNPDPAKARAPARRARASRGRTSSRAATTDPDGSDAALLERLRRRFPDRTRAASRCWTFIYAAGSPVDALLYSRLFWPELLEVDGAVLLRDGVEDEDDLARVRASVRERGPVETERRFNLRELSDLFGKGLGEIDDDQAEMLLARLAEMWRGRLQGTASRASLRGRGAVGRRNRRRHRHLLPPELSRSRASAGRAGDEVGEEGDVVARERVDQAGREPGLQVRQGVDAVLAVVGELLRRRDVAAERDAGRVQRPGVVGIEAVELDRERVEPRGAGDADRIGVAGMGDAFGADAGDDVLGAPQIDVVERDQHHVVERAGLLEQRGEALDQPVDPRALLDLGHEAEAGRLA